MKLPEGRLDRVLGILGIGAGAAGEAHQVGLRDGEQAVERRRIAGLRRRHQPAVDAGEAAHESRRPASAQAGQKPTSAETSNPAPPASTAHSGQPVMGSDRSYDHRTMPQAAQASSQLGTLRLKIIAIVPPQDLPQTKRGRKGPKGLGSMEKKQGLKAVLGRAGLVSC